MAGQKPAGGLEGFFIRVLTAVITSDAVTKMLGELMRNAADTVKADIEQEINHVRDSIESLEQNAINNIDSMDGKMGNLQEQMEQAPGHIVEGVVQGVLGPIEKLLQNPLGGLFGQR